jgi:hypothetical protein
MAVSTEDPQVIDKAQALVQLLRTRSYEEIRARMYDTAPGSPWWAACKAELDLRNGQQVADASLGMSRGVEKMRASTQHFEQLADTLCQTTNDVADLLRNTEAAVRRLEVVVYVAIGMTIVQFLKCFVSGRTVFSTRKTPPERSLNRATSGLIFPLHAHKKCR